MLKRKKRKPTILCSACSFSAAYRREDTLAKRGYLRLCPDCLGSYLRRGNYLYSETRVYYGNITHWILYHGQRLILSTTEATQLILNGSATDKANEIECLQIANETATDEQRRRKQGLKDGDRAGRL